MTFIQPNRNVLLSNKVTNYSLLNVRSISCEDSLHNLARAWGGTTFDGGVRHQFLHVGKPSSISLPDWVLHNCQHSRFCRESPSFHTHLLPSSRFVIFPVNSHITNRQREPVHGTWLQTDQRRPERVREQPLEAPSPERNRLVWMNESFC